MAAEISRPWHTTLFKSAAVLTYLLVASGGLVCITDASKGCPDWPVCHGRLIPPAQTDSIIEYTHRVGAALTLPVIFVALSVAWRRHRATRWVFRPVLGAVLGLLLVAWFGAAGVFWGLNRGWAAVDLGTRDRPVLLRSSTAAGVMLLAATLLAALTPAPDAGVVVPVATLLVTEGLWAFCVAVLARSALGAESSGGAPGSAQHAARALRLPRLR